MDRKTGKISCTLAMLAAVSLLGAAVVAAAPPAHRASGGGSFVAGSFGAQSLGFVAVQDVSGAITGQANGINHETFGHSQIHLDVDCLLVLGNEARISGIITKSDTPGFPVGGVAGFRVIDNSSGHQPDLVSGFVVNQVCTGPVLPNFIFPLRGNVQVH